jgi:hypothetical protein
MEWIIEKILARVSVKKLARSAYVAIRKKLVVMVQATETTFDDDALEVVDAIVEALIGEIKEA